MNAVDIAIPEAERVSPVRFVDYAPVYAEVAGWATSELGMDPDAVPAVENPPEWVNTTEARTIRATAKPVSRRIVVVDFGTVVEHRRHETWSDTPACWGERKDAPMPAGADAEPEIQCGDARCFGVSDTDDFRWFA